MKPSMNKLSVYIIAYNNEDRIDEALNSVAWADEIVVADSHSSDRTAEIARRYTDKVVQIDFQGFGKLRNAALGHCSHEWIFSLDTDERCTAQVKQEILQIINDPHAVDAYFIPRRNFFMGRWIRHSGWYPDYRQPQLFRKRRMRYTEDVVHEGYILDGRCAHLKGALWQMPFRDLSEIIAKMDRYSTLGAQKLLDKGAPGSMTKALFHGVWVFIRLYVFRLGFLDGWAGFIIALGNFEGTFYRYAKLTEMKERWNERKPPLQ